MEEFQSVFSPTTHITVSEHPDPDPDPENRLSVILDVTVYENVVDLIRKSRTFYLNYTSPTLFACTLDS